MNRFSDQMLARSMLDVRERGISYVLHIRRNLVLQGFFFGYFALILGLLAATQWWMPFAFMVGLFAGAILRDVGWIRATRKALPFTIKVMDWRQIEQLAKGE